MQEPFHLAASPLHPGSPRMLGANSPPSPNSQAAGVAKVGDATNGITSTQKMTGKKRKRDDEVDISTVLSVFEIDYFKLSSSCHVIFFRMRIPP